ncbi:MAG: acyl carrier protein [Cyanobacteria bacterium P01_G01_bin.38]
MNSSAIQSGTPPIDKALNLAEITVEDIQDWLATQIAVQIGGEADDIDLRVPFHRYGLDSVQAMDIATLGQQQFGVQLSPLVMWNCPNVASLSEYLAEELAKSDVEMFEI